jgi:hypothetical protein
MMNRALPFSRAVSEMVRKIKGVPASIRKLNSKSSPNEAAISKYHFTPVSSRCLRFDEVLTFYSACLIFRAGITIEYQLQVRDVLPIRLETRCPVCTKPGVEIQHLRPCDEKGPKWPIETKRLSVAEIGVSSGRRVAQKRQKEHRQIKWLLSKMLSP